MPEESKKGHDKKKNDPKEQRRPRQRHQTSEKQLEKKPTDSKMAPKAAESKTLPKVTVPQKPVYESPPPEFFQNLKRETDEILKITDEENKKYKKKEIQSNWTKYEMPIESYDEIEEQENMGADYEKLIQAPLSIGGHFQFKHEKSWHVNTGPSLYDKYFDINMGDLNLALCTIPFHERNSIDQSIFSQTDILSMNNRTARFKQKFFNDKSYATAETEAQDKILNSLREKDTDEKCISNDIEIKTTMEIDSNKQTKQDKEVQPIDENIEPNISLELKADPPNMEVLNIVTKEKIEDKVTTTIPKIETINNAKEKAEPAKKSNAEANTPIIEPRIAKPEDKVIDAIENDDLIFRNSNKKAEGHEIAFMKAPETIAPTPKAADPPQETNNPVIESPEDLEKWLDDFLDG